MQQPKTYCWLGSPSRCNLGLCRGRCRHSPSTPGLGREDARERGAARAECSSHVACGASPSLLWESYKTEPVTHQPNPRLNLCLEGLAGFQHLSRARSSCALRPGRFTSLLD